MKLLSVDTFFDKGECPHCRIRDLDEGDISIGFSDGKALYPKINLFIKSPQDLTNFKNSVLQAYEKFLKDSKDV